MTAVNPVSAQGRLPGITPAQLSPRTVVAQRFLASAYDTVNDLLETLDIVRTHRKAIEGRGSKGALASNEEDLLRAALALAGAGLDSSLKRLVRDTLPLILNDPEAPGSQELVAFAARQIGTQQVLDPARLAILLLSTDPRQALIDSFIDELTGSSIQSVHAVHRIATIVGIPQKHDVRTAITGLRYAFVARNQVAHELDLQIPLGADDRQKRRRSMVKTVPLIHCLLDAPQQIINEVAISLS